jgi:hypothetical protein
MVGGAPIVNPVTSDLASATRTNGHAAQPSSRAVLA